MKVRWLSEADVRSVLTVGDLLEPMEQALAGFSAGGVVQPIRSVVPVAAGPGLLGIMPAGTQLAERMWFVPGPIVLAPASRAIFGKKMELYAGMVENLDFHVGRLSRWDRAERLLPGTQDHDLGTRPVLQRCMSEARSAAAEGRRQQNRGDEQRRDP